MRHMRASDSGSQSDAYEKKRAVKSTMERDPMSISAHDSILNSKFNEAGIMNIESDTESRRGTGTLNYIGYSKMSRSTNRFSTKKFHT